MKITLSLNEAKAYIRQALAVPSDAEIIIRRPAPKPFGPLAVMVGEINGLRYNSDQKIPAIKRFRDTVPSGLAEAKWSIENWPKVKDFILKNRKSPVYEGEYPNLTIW